MKKKSSTDNRRSRIRFTPDLGCFVFVQFEAPTAAFKPTLSGLAVDESFSGCSFVCLVDKGLVENAIIRVKTGNLDPMPAEIRWAKKLSPKVMHVGVKYLV